MRDRGSPVEVFTEIATALAAAGYPTQVFQIASHITGNATRAHRFTKIASALSAGLQPAETFP